MLRTTLRHVRRSWPSRTFAPPAAPEPSQLTSLWAKLQWPRYWSWSFTLGLTAIWLLTFGAICVVLLRSSDPAVEEYGPYALFFCIVMAVRAPYRRIRDRLLMHVEVAERRQKATTDEKAGRSAVPRA